MKPYIVNVPISRLREGPIVPDTNVRQFDAAVEIDIFHDAKVAMFWDIDRERFINPSAEIYVYPGGEDTPIDTRGGIKVNLFRVNPQPANILVEWVEKLLGWVPTSWYVYSTDDYNFDTGAWE